MFCIEQFCRQWQDHAVEGPSKKPIERRRLPPLRDPVEAVLRANPPRRRESDIVKMRLEHWVDLAESALHPKVNRSNGKQNGKKEPT